MTSKIKASPWQIEAPGIPKETLKAFPSFKNPAMTAPKSKAFLALMADSSAAPGAAVVDWRSTGAVPTPGSQGACSTCSSFAVVSVVESLHFLKNHTRIQLAPGFIHSCLLNLDCNQGASAEDVLDAAAAHGIAYGFPNDYPFPTNHCATGNLYTVSRRAWLAGPNAAMEALANQGPVIGDMLIDPEFLKVGPGTIYQFQPTPDERLHTVAVVGYDLNQGFWIVANSFGTSWGDDGFGRVAFGSGGLLDERRGCQILL
jgi:plastocyanin